MWSIPRASIAMFDREMIYIVTSKRFLIDYELGERDLIGFTHYEIFPEIPERWKEIHKRCLAGETIKASEDTFLRANGKLDWICWEICPWYERNNEIGGIILFSEVITERKQMEEALRKSQEHYRSFFQNAPVGVFYSNTNGKIISVNDEYARMLGYASPEEAKELINHSTIEQMVYVNSDERFIVLEKTTAKPGTWCRNEIQFRKKEGTHIIANLLIRALPENTDLLEGFLEDITERKRAEETLRQSEERYRLLADNAPIPVAVASLETGKLLYFNNSAFISMGPASAGKEFHDFQIKDFYVNPEQHDKIVEILKKEGRIANLEIQLKNLNGKQITALVSSLITTFENEPAVFVSFYDITDRKLAEEMLVISEIRYRRLFESAKDGIFILDFETGIIVDVNPFLTELLDCKQEKLVGIPIWEIEFFRDIVPQKETFLDLRQKEYVRYEDLPLQKINGQQADVEFVSIVYSVDHRKVIQCNVRDITECKRMETDSRSRKKDFEWCSRICSTVLIFMLKIRIHIKENLLIVMNCMPKWQAGYVRS